MSVGYVGKTAKNDSETIGVHSYSEVESKWHDMPAEIVSFDAEKQTATVQPLFKPKIAGQFVEMPQLEEVPVRFDRAGFGGLTFPIQVGDKVVLRPQVRNSEKYHMEGTYEAGDARYNHLSDMEAYLAGGESLQEPIESFDNANTHLRFSEDGSFGLKGNNDGDVELTSENCTINNTSDYQINTNKMAFTGNSGEILDILAEALEKLSTDIDTGGDTMGFASTYASLATKVRSMQL